MNKSLFLQDGIVSRHQHQSMEDLKMAKAKKKEKPLKLDMTFEEALKKALNTPLPKKEKNKKKK